LLELSLVAAVLTILASLVYPSAKASLGYFKVNAAVDSVRGAWALARSRAIDDGRPYRFSVEPNGSHYRIAPDDSSYWPNANPSDDPLGKGMVLSQSLPEGVTFNVNGSANGLPSGGTANADSSPRAASGSWTTAAVFLPDGTARDDVQIVFQVRGARPMTLHLRGLTGSVSVQTLQP
jgi:Tfp pilus assembly protein FimT